MKYFSNLKQTYPFPALSGSLTENLLRTLFNIALVCLLFNGWAVSGTHTLLDLCKMLWR